MRAFVIIALVWMGFATLAHADPPPVEAFGRLPALSDAAISPDGTKIAMAVNANDQSAVSVFDLVGHQTLFTAGVGRDQQLRGVGWADDTHVSFRISTALRPREVLPANYTYRGAPQRVLFARPGVLNLATKRMRLLSTNEDVFLDAGAEFISPIEGEPGVGRLIGSAGYDPDFASVFSVNLDTGRARDLRPNGVNTTSSSYLIDARGQVITRTDIDTKTNRWSVYNYDNGVPHLLWSAISATGGAQALPQGLLSDGRLAVLADAEDGQFSVLYAVDRATAAREVLFKSEGHDVGGAIPDPWTRQVVGVAWTEDETKQRFFDATLQRTYEHVIEVFAGSAHLVSWSRDRRHVLVYGERGLDGGAYYVYDATSGEISRVAYLYPELAPLQSGVREAITYRARDGTRIPAYLTLPSADARNLPLIVLVHGGPGSRDTLDFDYWAAFFASRGYAVLQPNFRGSTGYGAAWEEAGLGQWGGLMQTDVEDGIAPVARSGIADASRVCIVGGSYGGYAALAGATLTPDTYKCAISVAGLSDLIDFVSHREQMAGESSVQADYWRRSIGDRHDDGAHLRAISPANLADRVHIPVLLIHGNEDTIVPVNQSRRMRARLSGAGKDVRYVELPGDDHWLSNAATRTQMLREMEAFLAQNLPAHAAN